MFTDLEDRQGCDKKEQDAAGFKLLFERYYNSLLIFANSFLLNDSAAEDIIQTIFVEVWQNGVWKKDQLALQGYLFAAVRNRSLNEIRNRKVKDTHDLRYVQAMLNVFDEGEMEEQLVIELKKRIAELPRQVKHIIELRYFEGKSVSETAEMLNISPNTVKTQVKRGRASLKIALLGIKLKIFFLFVTPFMD